MDNKRYTFVHVPDKQCKALQDKEAKDLLTKWSMKDRLQVQSYSFNQPFHAHRKQEFVEMFLADPVVYSSLLYNRVPVGKPCDYVVLQAIPCTVLTMEFFDRLLEPDAGVVRCDRKTLVQCEREEIEGFAIDDNLRNVILNEDSECYQLFSHAERKEFLWNLFCHLCLGGEWCQYEFSIEPYLTLAKHLYRDLISVERIGDTTELVIRSLVFKVQGFDKDKNPIVPINPENRQNFLYLIIDPFKRSIMTLTHSYGGILCV